MAEKCQVHFITGPEIRLEHWRARMFETLPDCDAVAPCPDCGSEGRVPVGSPFRYYAWEPCDTCNGTGKIKASTKEEGGTNGR